MYLARWSLRHSLIKYLQGKKHLNLQILVALVSLEQFFYATNSEKDHKDVMTKEECNQVVLWDSRINNNQDNLTHDADLQKTRRKVCI